tara:strand:- start:1134 stop:2171 length:1038 start_codon:yes stop_codon:yes gene_type:complete
MDLFLLEGNPILHRVGMSILSLLQERLLATGHSSEFAQILLGAGTLPLSKILSTAVQFELSRRQVHRLYLNNICCWKKTYEVNTLMFHRPLFNYDSSIVTRQEIEAIWFWMPRRFHTKEPELIFTTSVDGYSLGTFLRKCKGHEQSVLLIRTKYDHQLQYFHLVLQFSFLNSSDFKYVIFQFCLVYNVDGRDSDTKQFSRDNKRFGAFLSKAWQISSSFYGSGENFIFSFETRQKVFRWKPSCKTFHMKSTSKSLNIGGGYAVLLTSYSWWIKFPFSFNYSRVLLTTSSICRAISLDSDLLSGRTTASETYCSPPLDGSDTTANFTVSAIECYGLRNSLSEFEEY